MACSKCQERRDAIVRAGKAIIKGDVQSVPRELTFVAKTSAQDATSVFRQSVAAAKTRLSRK